MKITKLNIRGFTHDLTLIAFIAIFAIVGVGYLVASRADSCTPVSGPSVSGFSTPDGGTNVISPSPEGGTVSQPVSGCPASGPVTGPATPAPIIKFSASPNIVTGGAASTLIWASVNATSCVGGGGWSGSKATSGSASTGPLTATTIYALKCTGAGGVATASVTVTVKAPTPVPPKLAAACMINGVPPIARYGQTIRPILTISNKGTQAFTPQIQNISVTYTSVKGQVSRFIQTQALRTLQPGQSYSEYLRSSSVPYRTKSIVVGIYITKSLVSSSTAISPAFSCGASFQLPIKPLS